MNAQEKARQVIEQELMRMKQPRRVEEEDYCQCIYCVQRREYKFMNEVKRRAADVANFNPCGLY